MSTAPRNEFAYLTCYCILQKHNPDEKYWILFAASHVFNKVFFVDTRDASVFIWTVDRVRVMRAVPENSQTGVNASHTIKRKIRNQGGLYL